MPLERHITKEFERIFGSDPLAIVRSPGRVNLIGEHTDYNEGFVMPMAINRAIWIALRPRSDYHVMLHSIDFNERIEFMVHDLRKGAGWAEYIKGVAWALLQSGFTLHGFEGVVAGDVPIGAGLSSSAAWELAAARAFSMSSNFNWDAQLMARLCQFAENQWVGVNCGIMDQMISAAGKVDHALLIDCRSLEMQAVPLPSDTVVIVLDTGTRRGLVDSAYNERRSQCEVAARFFGVKVLRDVTIDQFEAQADHLEPLIRKRARHVISENNRTLKAAEAMRQGDAVELGKLIKLSHQSLRDDFEVSNHELDFIVEYADRQPGCYGARMTGAGFGGCAVALVQADAADPFSRQVVSEYQNETGIAAQIYKCVATNGAEIVKSPSLWDAMGEART